MKLILGLLCALGLSVTNANAAAVSASPFRVNYATTNLTTTNWLGVVVAGSMVKAVKGIYVNNASSSLVLLGLGASGSEVTQLVLNGSVSNVYIPMTASQNNRISIKASVGTISAGTLELNLLYN